MKSTTPAVMFCAIIALLFISSLYSAYAIPDSTENPPTITVPPPPPCELCNGKVVPWGNLQCSDFPLYGGACTVKVCYRKRECMGRKQIKILSTSFPPGTPCAI